MTTRVQGGRTATPNAPPANNSLQPGELYVEMATPLRLWTGVPTGVAATGTKLVLDAGAQAAANAGAVQKAGDTMTGPLVLSGAPAAPAQAANKSYVDALLVSPVFTGNPTAPTPPPGDNDQSIATTAFVAASYAPIASPTFTGNPQAPTPTLGDNDQSVATTQFVATAIAAQPGTVIAPTIPAFKAGQLWWDATGGSLYVGYDDGNTQAYVPATNIALPANVATKADVAVAMNNVGRNLIHNAVFTVAQRGAGPFTATGVQVLYSADRWQVQSGFAGDTMGLTLNPATDAYRLAIGDEAMQTVASLTIIGTATVGSYCRFRQRLEDVRRLAGKTVIVSFWAQGSVANKLGVSIDQNFGTGGSPSAAVAGAGQAVTLTTGWARYSVTLTIPSIAGKTMGAAGDSYSGFNIWGSAEATTYNAMTGGIGNQGSWFANIWGVQLEVAAPGQTTPTPLEKMDAQQTLAVCQRFYCVNPGWSVGGVANAGGWAQNQLVSFPVQMRAAPQVVATLSGGSGYTGASGAVNPNPMGFTLQVIPNAATYGANVVFTASADL